LNPAEAGRRSESIARPEEPARTAAVLRTVLAPAPARWVGYRGAACGTDDAMLGQSVRTKVVSLSRK